MSLVPPIRVLALSPIPEEGAGCRFRVSQYIGYLRSQGIEVTVSSFYTPDYFRLVYKPGQLVRKATSFVGLALKRLRELGDLKDYDLVWLYREAIPLGPPIVETLIAGLGKPIVYDFDDAIFLPSVSEANKAVGFLKSPGRAARVLRLSRHAVVGNEYLAQFARRYNETVTVLPTVVDTTRFVPRPELGAADRKLTVGWIGSPTTYPYLQDLGEVLQQVNAVHPFVLRVSGAGRPVEFPGLDVSEVQWSLAEEVRLFNTLDIGVYPLTDDEWSKGKCGFKAIQCMACGVPVVAAAVGVNREIIEDGVNGFLASSPDEWVARLGRLLTEPDLRAKFAAAGRRTIEERYSLRVTAPRLARVLASAAGRDLPGE